jgi:hypothetical protein
MRAWALQTSHARAELAEADFLSADFAGLTPRGVQTAWTPRAS